MYVIKNTETRKFVARSGEAHSYTRDIRKVRFYLTREAADNDRCPENEIVVDADAPRAL